MRRGLLFVVVSIIFVVAVLLRSWIPLRVAARQLLGLPPGFFAVQEHPLETESDPFFEANRRLLKPLGVVRLIRVLPAPKPTLTESAQKSDPRIH